MRIRSKIPLILSTILLLIPGVALAQLLIGRGLITKGEFYAKLKEVQGDYQIRKA